MPVIKKLLLQASFFIKTENDVCKYVLTVAFKKIGEAVQFHKLTQPFITLLT